MMVGFTNCASVNADFAATDNGYKPAKLVSSVVVVLDMDVASSRAIAMPLIKVLTALPSLISSSSSLP